MIYYEKNSQNAMRVRAAYITEMTRDKKTCQMAGEMLTNEKNYDTIPNCTIAKN